MAGTLGGVVAQLLEHGLRAPDGFNTQIHTGSGRRAALQIDAREPADGLCARNPVDRQTIFLLKGPDGGIGL